MSLLILAKHPAAALERGHVRLQPLALVCVIAVGLALKANLIHRDMISHPVCLLQDGASEVSVGLILRDVEHLSHRWYGDGNTEYQK